MIYSVTEFGWVYRTNESRITTAWNQWHHFIRLYGVRCITAKAVTQHAAIIVLAGKRTLQYCTTLQCTKYYVENCRAESPSSGHSPRIGASKKMKSWNPRHSTASTRHDKTQDRRHRQIIIEEDGRRKNDKKQPKSNSCRVCDDNDVEAPPVVVVVAAVAFVVGDDVFDGDDNGVVFSTNVVVSS